MTSDAGTFGDVRIAGRRVMLEPHNCFACGTLNAHGLHLALHAGEGRCWVDTTLDRRFEGWEGIAHGGVISTILDEVMAWAVVEHDLWGVTARMSVEFKRPVPIGRPIHGEGRVTSVRRRIVEAEGVLTDDDGTVLARATATFVGAPDDKKAELKARYGFVLVPDAQEIAATPGSVEEVMTPVATPSDTTVRAEAFVAAHLDAAVALGQRAADEAQDAAAIAKTLLEGLPALADPEGREGVRRVAPGIGEVLGVRNTLLTAVIRSLRAATRRDNPGTLLDIADHLQRQAPLELHWLANDFLERAITHEPERAWQLVRREAKSAADWITVDSLAHVVGRGILAEAYRWAELEQLVYSPSRWERRLVGSTVATIPFVDHTAGRTAEIARRGIGLVGELIGDSEPEVQKSLSWALRNLLYVDRDAVMAFLHREAAAAAEHGDGHRAWVVRDTFEKLPQDAIERLRATLGPVRKRPGAPSTSRAAAAAASFLGLGVDVPPAERPTIDRS